MMKIDRFKYTEWATAILLTLTILVLLMVRAQHAGALWRDECASVQLAEMPTLSNVLKNFQHESFPVVFPFTLRAYAAVFGTSDAAFRAFGVAVGTMMLIAIWLNARLLTDGPPLLSLVLLGLNSTFLIWGTSVRAYGIGSVAVLLAFGLIGKMLLQPITSRVVAALLASLASVQFLLYNSVLLVAIAAAVTAVCLVRGTRRPLIAIGVIGCACALSVLPYIGSFAHESQSTIVFGGPVTFGWFWEQLRLAFGNPVNIMTAIWVGLFVAVATGAAVRLYVIWAKKPVPEWDLLLFGLLAPVASIVSYFVFLKIVSYRTREWYYLALLSILAGTIDLVVVVLSRIKWIRISRLAFVIAALVGMPLADWPKLQERLTNLDFVARKLESVAQSDDLIVVNPWYLGVTFNSYYHATTPWVAVPTMSDHKVHRFDLLKTKMMSSTPLDDLYEMIGRTLQSGNRVWFVGGVKLLPPGRVAVTLPPAPNSEFGWSGDAYAESWSQQLGDFLRRHASAGQFIPVSTGGPVNELENVSLLVASGWRE
jgi:hypothetical protein